MAIITISRQLGSMGSKIARRLKDELGYKFLDKESLEQLMGKYGITEEYVDTYDEKKPGFWVNLSLDKNRYLHFMKKAILEFAREGKCIILGRGGQVILESLPATLHIRIIAPQEKRIERIKELFECDNYNAEQIIKRSDNDRAGYHKFFFNTEWDSYGLYDLIFNTKLFDEETIVTGIKAAINSIAIIDKQEEAERQLQDLYLGHEIITRIIYKENISIQFVDAVSVDGNVTLRGSAVSRHDISLCEEVAKGTPGVESVKNKISFIPVSYGVY